MLLIGGDFECEPPSAARAAFANVSVANVSVANVSVANVSVANVSVANVSVANVSVASPWTARRQPPCRRFSWLIALVPRRVRPWSRSAPMTLLYEWLDRAARDRGNEKALIYRDNYLSWRGLKHRVERRVQEFQGMGLKQGEWVGLMLGNVPDFAILTLALSRLGVTVVPIDPTTGSRELELALDAVPLRALITRPRGSDQTMPLDPAARRAQVEDDRKKPDPPENRRRLQGTLLTCSIFKDPKDQGTVQIDAVPPPKGAPRTATVGTRRESAKAATGARDLTALLALFTSDSAGDPKAVLRTRENLEAIAAISTTALELDKDDIVLCAVPLFHSYGWDLGFLPALALGATVYLEEELSARRVAKILREQEIDVLPGTPTLYAGLAKVPVAKPLRRKNARFISAGSALPLEVAESFHARYGVRLMSAYHTTEAGPLSLDRTSKNPESVGKVLDGVDFRLTGPSGEKLSATADGVIWARGKSVSPKTLGPFPPMVSRPGRVPVGGRDEDGWLRTGDLGRLDRTGRLFLVGREDDLVKVDGKRVALGEVESCLESFPKVRRAQARVISDPLTGPMVIAKVVARGKCKAEDIIDHCARNLAPYKVPRRIEFCERLG